MKELTLSTDSLWILLSAILVILMQAGFAFLEAGSLRSKNAGHITGKQIITLAIASLVFWAVGYGIAFGDGNSFIGLSDFFLSGVPSGYDSIFFLFQMAFAAVSLAIAWGGFAERAKLSVYFIFGTVFIAIIYPVVGHWVWGGGWLSTLGMQDFAGSTVVHLQGATAALIGTLLLGPRIGKFTGKKPNTLPAHSIPFVYLGTFILWIGWFGFNAGSTVSVGNGQFFGYVALTTNLAAASGALGALAAAKALSKKADIGAMCNGVLAALVAITASCAFVEPWAAVVIGAFAGAFTYWTSIALEKKGLDDPIYAFSVHGISGVIGTLSTGLFAAPELVKTAGVGRPGLFYGGGLTQLGVQALGVVAAFAFVAVASLIVLSIIKATVGLRVSAEAEKAGLDISEHGTYGYGEKE
ncbi:ammonium transporter [Sporolactobacillus sp. THM19-2]|jgi:Amt family ammonium transporter|uniref:ammonium transporter n=1 Tax=Sporolactobacillus sp. THM19-2 TaxID=2511171 RepID=UPI0010213949|nr:ammonium transporter [Sporolactobacillus sp. THM19-2]RYL93166.1 ammonium transporter [Sporolactobacillus sp. THM19-2]